MIYLDNAATTFPKPNEVYETMDNVNRNYAVNAGRGSYKVARQANDIIEESKTKLLKLVNYNGIGKVAYTPSVTIALNEILHGLDFRSGDVIYVSPYEHNAVARTLTTIQKEKNVLIRELPICEDSLEIDIEKLKYVFLKERPKCVCCTHISNVTGYILPVNEIFMCAKEFGAITVLDAAQSMGLLKIDLNIMPVDFLAFTGHKTLYGPFGIAGFIDNSNVTLKEYIVGGTGSDSLNLNMPQVSPNKYESASPNIIAIAGLNSALDVLNIDELYQHEKMLTNYLVEKLENIINVILYIPKSKSKHIGIVSFNVKGYKAEDIGIILDEDYDIAVRTGYHCAPYIHRLLKNDESTGTIRIGLGRFNTIEDIDKLILAIEELNE